MSHELSLGDRVLIDRRPKTSSKKSSSKRSHNNYPLLRGKVAYLGPVSFAEGEDWVGVRLTGTSIGCGKNNGTVDGVRYFDSWCPKNGGIFVRRSAIKVLTWTEIEADAGAVTTPKRPPLIASSSNPAVAAAIPSRRRTRPTPRPRITRHDDIDERNYESTVVKTTTATLDLPSSIGGTSLASHGEDSTLTATCDDTLTHDTDRQRQYHEETVLEEQDQVQQEQPEWIMESSTESKKRGVTEDSSGQRPVSIPSSLVETKPLDVSTDEVVVDSSEVEGTESKDTNDDGSTGSKSEVEGTVQKDTNDDGCTGSKSIDADDRIDEGDDKDGHASASNDDDNNVKLAVALLHHTTSVSASVVSEGESLGNTEEQEEQEHEMMEKATNEQREMEEELAVAHFHHSFDASDKDDEEEEEVEENPQEEQIQTTGAPFTTTDQETSSVSIPTPNNDENNTDNGEEDTSLPSPSLRQTARNSFKRNTAVAKNLSGEKFTEFILGYTHVHPQATFDQYTAVRVGDPYEEFVEMDKPRLSSYRKRHEFVYGKEGGYVSEVVSLGGVRDGAVGNGAVGGVVEGLLLLEEENKKEKDKEKGVEDGKPTVIPIEYRGITPRQLRAVRANVERRCAAEGWKSSSGVPLTPDQLTHYDVMKYVVEPFVRKVGGGSDGGGRSFVEALPSTKGWQQPRFLVSYWWGEPFFDFMSCIERMLIDYSVNTSEEDDRVGGGMTEDTPLWIWGYAMDVKEGEEEGVQDGVESFRKALRVAQGRAISIVDRDGFYFGRIWCVYELYRILIDNSYHCNEEETSTLTLEEEAAKKRLWVAYVAKPHVYVRPAQAGIEELKERRYAVGIVSKGAPCDEGFAPYTAAREKAFPFNVVVKSLSIRVEQSKASRDSDREHLLADLMMDKGDSLCKPQKYTAVDRALRGWLASSPSTLAAAWKKGFYNEWVLALISLSEGSTLGEMNLNFFKGGEWSGMPVDRAIQLVEHLPTTIRKLSIWHADFGSEFMRRLFARIGQMNNLTHLCLGFSVAGGGGKSNDGNGVEIGVLLANVLAANYSMTTIELKNTDLVGQENVEQWGDALAENKTLTKLDLRGVSGTIKNKLRTRLNGRSPLFLIIT